MGSASGYTHDSKEMDGTPYADNLFNQTGLVSWFRNKGKNKDDHRSYLYHTGVEALPEGSQYTREGITFWPGSETLAGDTKFYPGFEFALSHFPTPSLNNDKDIVADWQIQFWIAIFRTPYDTFDWTRDDPNDHYAPGRPIYFYPSTDTNYLFRIGDNDTEKNDKFMQFDTQESRLMRLWASKPISPDMFMTDIYYCMCQGTVNTKEYYYAWKISNLKPMMSIERPKIIYSIDDYNHYFPPKP